MNSRKVVYALGVVVVALCAWIGVREYALWKDRPSSLPPLPAYEPVKERMTNSEYLGMLKEHDERMNALAKEGEGLQRRLRGHIDEMAAELPELQESIA
ncbi:MAG: hypothetical protein FWF84_06370, partial [Kiritimatiellaeota bacterium]|nr:hypothetical protein [Kiritimatiellota bacterium]